MNARVALLKVEPTSTEGNVKDPINLDVTFEAYEDMPEEIEFEMVVAWDGDHTNDQVLDSIEVGPVKKGKHQFIFDASKVIDFGKVKNEYTTDVCVLFLHCAYRSQRFASVSFYISHQYTDEEMRQNPPEKVDLDKIKRVISVEDFRVTTFPIKWTETDDLMPPPEETVDEELQNGDSQSVEPPIAMSLYVYPSFFDLLSLDPHSLKFIALARFCAADIKIIQVGSSSESPAGVVPSFVNDDVTITEFEDFVEYMQNSHREIVIDYELTPEQKSLSTAYIAMINEKLVPALEQTFWIDNYNYDSLTRVAYSSTLKFPHYLFSLHSRRNAATKHVEALKKQTKDLLKDAISTLNALSAKLGDSKYFNGTKPSSLDAFIFGLLAPLLKLPLANEHLKHHLESQPNLSLYLENISSIYLPLSEEQLRASVKNRADFLPEVETARKALETRRNTDQIKKAEKEKVELDSKKNVLIFGVVTVALSLLFAVHSGIIQESVFSIDVRQKVVRKKRK